MSEGQRASLMRLNRDVPLFCHGSASADAACPLVASAAARERLFDSQCVDRAAVCAQCERPASWQRPLHRCPHAPNAPPLHHAECAGYSTDSHVPSDALLPCPACQEKHGLSKQRARLVWEASAMQAELAAFGYRVVEVPRNGLAFLTVLHMLAHRCDPNHTHTHTPICPYTHSLTHNTLRHTIQSDHTHLRAGPASLTLRQLDDGATPRGGAALGADGVLPAPQRGVRGVRESQVQGAADPHGRRGFCVAHARRR